MAQLFRARERLPTDQHGEAFAGKCEELAHTHLYRFPVGQGLYTHGRILWEFLWRLHQATSKVLYGLRSPVPTRCRNASKYAGPSLPIKVGPDRGRNANVRHRRMVSARSGQIHENGTGGCTPSSWDQLHVATAAPDSEHYPAMNANGPGAGHETIEPGSMPFTEPPTCRPSETPLIANEHFGERATSGVQGCVKRALVILIARFNITLCRDRFEAAIDQPHEPQRIGLLRRVA